MAYVCVQSGPACRVLGFLGPSPLARSEPRSWVSEACPVARLPRHQKGPTLTTLQSTGSGKGVYPSGQRGQTVNLLAMPSQVRILSRPLGVYAGKCGQLHQTAQHSYQIQLVIVDAHCCTCLHLCAVPHFVAKAYRILCRSQDPSGFEMHIPVGQRALVCDHRRMTQTKKASSAHPASTPSKFSGQIRW
jgi:hypothetical protein